MGDNQELLLHLGYQKCGSTYLQDHIFTDPHSGFTNPVNEVRLKLHDEFVLCDPFTFDPQRANKPFLPACVRALKEGNVPVLSDENLIGHPAWPLGGGQLIVERLASAFPMARVVVCIREQKDLLYSFYSEMLKHSETRTLSKFIGETSPPSGALQPFRWDFFEYDKLISCCYEAWGKERVLVLPFEKMKQDPSGFVSKIIEFSGARPRPGYIPRQAISNVRLSGWNLDIRRLLNLASPSPDYTRNPQPLGFRISTRMSQVTAALVPRQLNARRDKENRELIESRIGDYFSSSNLRTSSLIDQDLAELGYS